ncbi:MAG: YaiI/YqxD family protein [bacterium]
MKIYVDADGCPAAIIEILSKAVFRKQIYMVLVANHLKKGNWSDFVSSVVVPEGPDVADDRIIELMSKGDLVITTDIPLASRVVEKRGFALNPRGELYTEENIAQKLSVRNFMDELRGTGVDTGGPSSFSNKHKQAFSHALDRFLAKSHNSDS